MSLVYTVDIKASPGQHEQILECLSGCHVQECYQGLTLAGLEAHVAIVCTWHVRYAVAHPRYVVVAQERFSQTENLDPNYELSMTSELKNVQRWLI